MNFDPAAADSWAIAAYSSVDHGPSSGSRCSTIYVLLELEDSIPEICPTLEPETVTMILGANADCCAVR